MGVQDFFIHGQQRFVAGQRLPDDAGKKTGGGLVGLAGAHADGRQPQPDAVEKATAGIVGN